MQYYIIKNSTGNDIGDVEGIQLKGRSSDYPYNNKSSFQFLPDLAAPKITPNFEYLIVEDRAIMTDFISCTGIIYAIGFMLSNRAKELLEKFKLPEHYFYPARLLHQNKFYEYYWFHPARDFIYDIDYRRSTFVTKKPAPWPIPDWNEQIVHVEVDSPQTLIKIRKENAGSKILAPEVLCMNKLSNSHYDLLAFSSFGENSVMVSKKLKDAIEEWHLSGLEICELGFEFQYGQ